jgi:FkbM family methyltransferase
MISIMSQVRSTMLSLISKLIQYLQIRYNSLPGIYLLTDGFGAFEENLLTNINIYFDVETVKYADTVIDLGAHIGTFTLYAILHAKPNTCIIAVELDRTNYRILLNNMRKLSKIIKEKNIKIITLNMAVWYKQGKFRFRNIGWSEGGYLTGDPCTSQYKECVDTITLDKLIELSNGRIIAKIDIEGAELPVLLFSKSHTRISDIAMEPHGNETLITKILRQYGYSLQYTEDKLNPTLYKYWINISPKIFGISIALYRLLVSTVLTPKITILKATKPYYDNITKQ